MKKWVNAIELYKLKKRELTYTTWIVSLLLPLDSGYKFEAGNWWIDDDIIDFFKNLS